MAEDNLFLLRKREEGRKGGDKKERKKFKGKGCLMSTGRNKNERLQKHTHHHNNPSDCYKDIHLRASASMHKTE